MKTADVSSTIANAGTLQRIFVDEVNEFVAEGGLRDTTVYNGNLELTIENENNDITLKYIRYNEHCNLPSFVFAYECECIYSFPS